MLGGGGYWYSRQRVSATEVSVNKTSNEKAFKGGDEFLSLKLDSVEKVNHNTKKFRFLLPEDDMQSGLAVACMYMHQLYPHRTG